MKYIVVIIALGLGGCAGTSGVNMQTAAAEYCESVGGERMTRESALGTGRYCRLPDGRVENEWHLYRTEHLEND
ncbi:DUF333 domain-containing protein [Halomonas meridiana]|uniref:putative hemolysin n=1 Tax=Vreelandella aquamarina TaxID=77097 RepID=UPI00273BB3AD|nr:DUF333 domain-containing protein [Halomonas meridiana]MDP4556265.1 DUF333 domain-containing protein [Halomonas meridiana]